MIRVRIALADLFGHMGQVEFDRPTATRLEIYERWPDLRAEQVAAWVWLAVQQLLGGVAASTGETGDPCGVPFSRSRRVPSAICMGAFSHRSM